ncbi:MAG: hypothetical protein IAE66_06670 [Xanthomonadaceae bacterium]|nr:hypothetical protein [Xanthomonadaceae bacterium]
MERFACLLACLLAFPLAAQEPARDVAPASPRKADVELPLPATPIPVPALSPKASKTELVTAYYDITGRRMFQVLLNQFLQPPASMQARVANCPEAKQLMETHYRDVVQPHFRDWLENSIRPRIIVVLNDSFGEAELRAFLRFAATPNGQRHLNQIATQQGRSDVSRFPEFLQDADLRAYDRQFDTMGDRIGEVFANTQTELMTPAFIQAAQASGTRIAELVDACNAASKP